jgi:hypothetical protein
MWFVKIPSVKFRYFVGTSATSLICSGLNVILILNFLSIAIPDACHFDCEFSLFSRFRPLQPYAERFQVSARVLLVLMMTRDAMERFGIVSALIY